ncbi:MAG: ATP-binding cassette domain-containing protein [Lachnospiraceae bacterium]|nr:ATP-binding cassette domain-containing protein [Lachnospiraceae bacterium]
MNRYELRPGHRIMPQNNGISYRVASGTVFVSVLLAYSDGSILSKKTIGIARAGVIIPGYAEAKTHSGKELIAHMLIEPKDVALIEEIPFDEAHKKNFLESVGFESQGEEDTINSTDIYSYLIHEYFYRERSKDKFIEKNLEQHRNNKKIHEEIIVSAYNLNRERDSDADIIAENKLYQGMEFLCKKIGVTIASLTDVRKASGGEVSVQLIASCSGFLCREIELSPKFYKEEISPLVCFAKDDNRPIVIYRNILNRKYYYDPKNQKHEKLNAKVAANISKDAYCIHRPLNGDKLDLKTLIRFGMREFYIGDLLVTIIAMLLVAWVGIQVSTLNTTLYDRIIPQGSVNNLLNYGMILIGCSVGSLLFSISQNIASYRQDNKIKYALQAAIFNRVFHMPEKFYRNHESGELAYRAGTAASSYYTLYTMSTAIILHLAYAIIYFVKMTDFSSGLAGAGLFFAFFNVALTVLVNQFFLKYRRKQSSIMGKMKSYMFQLFSGIDTIRAMGAEDAAMYEYMDKTAEWSVTNYKYGFGDRITEAITTAITCVVTLIIYDDMVKGTSSMSTGMFIGYTTIYACFTGAVSAIANEIAMIYSMIPMLKNSMDILKTAPEMSNKGEILTDIEGDIKIVNLNFSYGDKPVLRNINLHIQKGEYVAIVGATGCGKSTLLKLLLGFEEPTSGDIRYDDKSLSWLSKPALRRFFGVVLQEDGLFMGPIYKNIIMSNSDCTEEDIIRVLEEVGLIEDIKAMPLGLMTPVSEDAHTLSGGQVQRIFLARALIGNPRILLLDEATSSLDNIGQKIISDSIEKRKITRVVIAHRLSTIINSDRIIVLDKGMIAEEGTYSELIQKGGLFKKLVENQALGGVNA